MIEVLVSFTLLTSVLTVTSPLLVRYGRLLTNQRQYRLGLDEVCNQLDRLSVLPAADLREALGKLTVSEFAAKKLPGATLHGELDAVDVGYRLTLRLNWGDSRRQTASIAMAAWIAPSSSQSGD